ncbi:hypothetical protein E4T52_12458 [Aureobasidium sp. EXF-3400]|nr:hypothetical protein E4T51_11456 [Aureobasidium sp. EXF-12344]KAI4772566.1 hypothetical protein E4T52_12458 [Aureobasidium sp. EXF-3400]
MTEKLSIEECQAHIRDIRNKHGADQPKENEGFLRRGFGGMLDMLSKQLYSQPSHFLFELIQNADDNTYADGVQPEATLAYRSDGLLLFGCNERGFSKADVSAICDINQSTKTLLKKSDEGRIGEKGIGFKSVFKVADKVWITSNNFSFMFDRTKPPLGMVDPVWAKFPDFPEQLQMNTMICLKIKKQEDRDAVREQLTKVLDPSAFMFLRRLTKVRVVRLDDSGDTFDELVMSHDYRPFTDDLEVVTTTRSKGTKSWKSRYLLSDYVAREMPPTELRQGVTETSIKLAFPINDEQQPLVGKQDVYAFLPICSSGLPFLIQADFLLVASRQGIDESQPWNRRLKDHMVHALIQAFQRLNDTRLRYLWPTYIPDAQVALGFFDQMKDKFLDRVKDIKILESRSGELAKPKVMMLVPDQYKDEDGTPLLTPVNDRYLSTKYDTSKVTALVTQALDDKKFFEMLKTYVSKQTDEFRNKSDTWHGKVSTVLMIAQKQINLDELLVMPIVPLDDGSWISARSRHKPSYSKVANKSVPLITFYLPRSDANIVIPKGVSLSVVEHNASRNEERRNFFRRIGAQDLDYEDVLRGIIKQHKESMTGADIDLLLSHAQYVFSMPSASKMAQNLSTILWMTDSRGKQARGIELHMDNPSKPAVSDMFSANPTVARFIHPKYLEIYQEDVELRTRWLTWLQECLGVHDIPRLSNKTNKDLSREFEWLVNNLPSIEWLNIIRLNWDDYHLSAPPKLGDMKIPSEDVRNRIASLSVDCTDGRRAKLKDTILPTLRSAVMTIQHMGFHFLDVKDEQNSEWTKFSVFGVITHRDLDFCLKLLMKFPASSIMTDKMTVIKLYRDIHMFCEGSMHARDRTRAAFKEHPLIFLPESSKWVHLMTCVWEAPSCLRKVRSIAHIYGPVQPFFKNILNLHDAGIPDFLNELITYDNVISSTILIKELLLELGSRVNPRLTYDFKALDNCRIFPVINEQKQQALMTGNDSRWFIPDGRNLKVSFEGIIPLLNFTLGEQKRLEPLLDKMGIWGKHLSEKVTKQEVVEGKDQATKDAAHTRKFQVKAHYLLCLTNPAERYLLKPLLESIEIWAVKSIKVHRSIRIDNQEIRGKPLPANIMLDKDQRIFVPLEDLENNELNYYELSEKLTTLCKLENVSKELPVSILSISSIQQIEDMLEEHGVIFDKLEIRKLTNKITPEPAAAVLPARRKLVGDTPPEMITDDGISDSADSDLSSLAALKDIGVRVKLARKPKPAAAPRTTGQNRNGRVHVGRDLSTDDDSTEQQSDDEDWDKDSAPMSTGGAPSRRPAKTFYGSGHRMRSSYFDSSVAMSDEDINDIDSETSENSTDTAQRAQASEYRKQLDAVENIAEDPQVVRIGEQGEMKTYGFLKNLPGDYFTDDMWTSHASTKYTDLQFTGDDSQFADFTIRDLSGRLTDWLVERGCKQPAAWLGKKNKDSITYSIEVKTTYGSRHEPFHMSQNQIDMAREYRLQGDEVPNRVYVIMRVSSLAGSASGGNAQVHPFVDPYGLFEQGGLSYISQGGYLVFSDQKSA